VKISKLTIRFIDNPAATKVLNENLESLGITTQLELQTNDCADASCILIGVSISATATVLVACINALAKIECANIESSQVQISVSDEDPIELKNRLEAIDVIDNIRRDLDRLEQIARKH